MQQTRVPSLSREKSPGEGNGYPLLGNPMDRGAWQGFSPWGCKRVGHNLGTKQEQAPQQPDLDQPHLGFSPGT